MIEKDNNMVQMHSQTRIDRWFAERKSYSQKRVPEFCRPTI